MKVDREDRTPLYIQVYERLLKEIQEGRFEKGAYLPSEKDLGDLFGVDRQTVRRSLGILVKEGTVQKRPGLGSIVADGAELRVSRSSSRVLSLVFPTSPTAIERITEPFQSRLFSAIEAESATRGVGLQYQTIGPGQDVAALLSGPNIAGVAFVSSLDDSVFARAADIPVPVVVVNGYSPLFTSVLPDAEEGAYQAVRHLIEIGHRRIGYIAGPSKFVTSVRRLQGYRRALLDADISAQEQPWGQGDWTFDGGFRAMQQILKDAAEVPTAVFACNDMTAIGAISAITSAGMSVPGDMSVMGFDNIDQCRQTRPKVSTVDVDVRLMARAACHLLLCETDHGALRGTQILVPARLEIRQSTAPPREAQGS
ncbi:MAG: GntR family transcriptional regulator [Spirochaetia bacterium]